MILKTEADTVHYYNIKTFQLVKVTKTQNKGLDYTENDYMIVTLTQSGDTQRGIYLYGKPVSSSTMIQNKSHYVETGFLFTLEENVCYVVTATFVVWGCTWVNDRWEVRLVGRYYGSDYDRPAAIHVYERVVYMVTKYGFVLREIAETKNFHRVFNYSIPQHKGACKWVLFHKYDVAVAVKTKNRRVSICYDRETNHMRLECPNMSCATEHGHVVFLGFRSGRIIICLTNKTLKKGSRPERTLRVQDFDNTIKDPKILAIDVFEDKLSHHLFVATKDRVLQLHIKYPPKIARLFA
ncbi:unnamed protein product [Chrysodeixis includens]|uniref:Uncharacterized protein n=1 Tax=Chrysodeixis includens TaxID=689277 RepID=A0A9N8L2Y4_CHRIL|nr:unnamed protein product [Chrysodeixis includens]